LGVVTAWIFSSGGGGSGSYRVPPLYRWTRVQLSFFDFQYFVPEMSAWAIRPLSVIW